MSDIQPLGTLQDKAEDLARHIAADHLPTDAGAIAQLRDAVTQAERTGYARAMRLVLDAYRLFLVTDEDPDGFRDTLTELSQGMT